MANGTENGATEARISGNGVDVDERLDSPNRASRGGGDRVTEETRNRESVTYVCAVCAHEWREHSHKGRRGTRPNVRLECTLPKCACVISLASAKRTAVTEEIKDAAGWRYARTIEVRFEGVTPKVIA